MCFSSSASFSVGVIIAGFGTISLIKAEKPNQKMFAAMPLIFAAQQFTEGTLWLALENNNVQLQKFSTMLFLFIAQVIWPLWVPLSIRILEKNRKLSLDIMTIFGAGVSIYLAYCLFSYHVSAKIESYHILYQLEYPPTIRNIGGIIYLIVTIAPPFFASLKHIWILGSSIFVSYVLAFIFYESYVISVWCFFSAVISILVLYFVNHFKNEEATNPS
ncbi:MAG: DUF6629 family protein [Bacteroidia bacterium]